MNVYFVGAGPGAPDLLTVRALRLLQEADIVLYDALVSAEILAIIRKGAQRICVGKRAGRHSMAQGAINRLLVKLARQGRRIVRLKGGDPTLFGRLAEEIAALREAGLAFEIVPGITTASAAAARAGFSLTERGIARRVQFVTGHLRAGDGDTIDWRALADPQTTTVVHMGREAAAEISRAFVDAGLAPGAPVLLIANASRADEVQRVADLATLVDAVRSMPSDAPLMLVIGDVARLARACDTQRTNPTSARSWIEMGCEPRDQMGWREVGFNSSAD